MSLQRGSAGDAKAAHAAALRRYFEQNEHFSPHLVSSWLLSTLVPAPRRLIPAQPSNEDRTPPPVQKRLGCLPKAGDTKAQGDGERGLRCLQLPPRSFTQLCKHTDSQRRPPERHRGVTCETNSSHEITQQFGWLIRTIFIGPRDMHFQSLK